MHLDKCIRPSSNVVTLTCRPPLQVLTSRFSKHHKMMFGFFKKANKRGKFKAVPAATLQTWISLDMHKKAHINRNPLCCHWWLYNWSQISRVTYQSRLISAVNMFTGVDCLIAAVSAAVRSCQVPWYQVTWPTAGNGWLPCFRLVHRDFLSGTSSGIRDHVRLQSSSYCAGHWTRMPIMPLRGTVVLLRDT